MSEFNMDKDLNAATDMFKYLHSSLKVCVHADIDIILGVISCCYRVVFPCGRTLFSVASSFKSRWSKFNDNNVCMSESVRD